MINQDIAVWLEFIACLAVIGYAGAKLSKYGDAIADKTGLGRTWVGLIMLGTVTSLPELVTGVVSVTAAQAPEIAAGDILGSCVFNLLIIVILDFLHRRESVYSIASQGHILSAGFGIILIGFAGLNILLSESDFYLSIGHVGWYSFIILILYAIAIRTLFRYESQQIAAFTEMEPDRYPQMSLKAAVLRYLGSAVLIVIAGSILPFVAKAIATQMGWHEGFVGTLFVALVTSAPELVVTIAALRLAAVDMAIGNLFGSNLFNILVLAVDDFFFTEGPLLSHISPTHSVTALSGIMMTGVAIIGLLYKTEKRVFKTVGWVSIFLLMIYIINTYVLFLYSKSTP